MSKKNKDKQNDSAIWKIELDRFYKEARDNNQILWPDEAMKKYIQLIEKGLELIESSSSQAELKPMRGSGRADLIKAHKYAVDLFYKYHFPAKKGASLISSVHLSYLIKLHYEEDKSYREIALLLEPNLETIKDIERAEDRVRKRIESGKDRGL
ncbi:MAG TPA: hypothetical protein VGC66_24285 [Pyrinomonadaceae bacterium]|jgi:hypothetical protein